MAPRPGHRLDMVFVPHEPPASLEISWPADVLAPGGSPGPAADTWVQGGFRRWRFDRPGHTVLYANQQGGFQVRCPVDARSLVKEFSAVMAARESLTESTIVRCGCGQPHRVDALVFLPEAAFGRCALILHDVGAAALTDIGRVAVTERLGPLRIVLRRLS